MGGEAHLAPEGKLCSWSILRGLFRGSQNHCQGRGGSGRRPEIGNSIEGLNDARDVSQREKAIIGRGGGNQLNLISALEKKRA